MTAPVLLNRAATSTLLASMLFGAAAVDVARTRFFAEMSSNLIMNVVSHEATCPCRRLK